MLLNELISSKIQLKWVQEVWARSVLWYGAREYAEIERVQHEDLINDRVEKLMIFSYGQPRVRILIGKGYRAHTMLKMSN